MPDYNVSTYPQTPPAGGERLFGWTDNEALHAWDASTSPTTLYTKTTTPTVNTSLYDANNNLVTDYAISAVTQNSITIDEVTKYAIGFTKGSLVKYYTINGITYNYSTLLNLAAGNYPIGVSGTYLNLSAVASGHSIIGSSVMLVGTMTINKLYAGILSIDSNGLVSISYEGSSSFYEFGTSFLTIAFEGSTTGGGGND